MLQCLAIEFTDSMPTGTIYDNLILLKIHRPVLSKSAYSVTFPLGKDFDPSEPEVVSLMIEFYLNRLTRTYLYF